MLNQLSKFARSAQSTYKNLLPKLSDLLNVENGGAPQMIKRRRKALFHLVTKGF
jgi:hypothetical protein